MGESDPVIPPAGGVSPLYFAPLAGETPQWASPLFPPDEQTSPTALS